MRSLKKMTSTRRLTTKSGSEGIVAGGRKPTSNGVTIAVKIKAIAVTLYHLPTKAEDRGSMTHGDRCDRLSIARLDCSSCATAEPFSASSGSWSTFNIRGGPGYGESARLELDVELRCINLGQHLLLPCRMIGCAPCGTPCISRTTFNQPRSRPAIAASI